MITFSNPSLNKEFDNWPSGGKLVDCVFIVQKKKDAYRVEKRTTKNGVWCKPKVTTYGGKMAIVDGSDGKTYILQRTIYNEAIRVSSHDFMDVPSGLLQASGGYVYRDSNRELYDVLNGLIESCYP